MLGEEGQDKNGAVDKSDGTAQNAEMSSKALTEWIKNWPIVLASFIGIGLCLSPLPYYAVIILGPEFGKEFGWDRVTIQTGLLFMTAGVLMGAPIAGSLTDQFGTRRVLLPAIIALGILTASFGFMNANPIVYYAIFYLTAILGAGTLPLTWSKAIVNNFDKTRGLALGIALTGTGVYGFLAPPFIQDIAHTINWRAAYCPSKWTSATCSLPAVTLFTRPSSSSSRSATRCQTSSFVAVMAASRSDLPPIGNPLTLNCNGLSGGKIDFLYCCSPYQPLTFDVKLSLTGNCECKE